VIAPEEKSDDERKPRSSRRRRGSHRHRPRSGEAAARFASIAKIHTQVLGSIAKLGARDPKTLRQRKRLADEFMELRLSPRMFDALILNLRTPSRRFASSRRRS